TACTSFPSSYAGSARTARRAGPALIADNRLARFDQWLGCRTGTGNCAGDRPETDREALVTAVRRWSGHEARAQRLDRRLGPQGPADLRPSSPAHPPAVPRLPGREGTCHSD